MSQSIFSSFCLYISSFFKSYRECKVVMLGESGGGKTTLLYRVLKNQNQINVFTPTIGFNIEEVDYKDLKLKIFDVGAGGGRLHPLWPHYFEKDLKVLIYMIDCSDRERFEEATTHLLDSIKHQNFPKQAIVQVLANKQGSITVNEIKERLEMDSKFCSLKYNIQSISAIDGTGVNEFLNWIYENIN